MYATGHYGAALILYGPVAYVLVGTEPYLAVLGGAGTLLLATLPDVDHRFPGVSHRGPTHSLAFCVAVAACLAGVVWFTWGGIRLPGSEVTRGRLEMAAFAALVSVVSVGSHLLADAFTAAGIDFFWPVPISPVSLSDIASDHSGINWALFVLGTLVTVVVWLGRGPT